jgi:hypothetical protein
MVDFDEAHKRYWKDQHGYSGAQVPMRGGHVIVRDGKTYAVLFTNEDEPVAAYGIIERLAAVDPRFVATFTVPKPKATAPPPVQDPGLKKLPYPELGSAAKGKVEPTTTSAFTPRWRRRRRADGY